MEQSIIVTDDSITIAGHLFVHKDFSVTNKELLVDAFSVHYTGQHVNIIFWDGENVEFSGFKDFIKYLCTCFNIPNERVTFKTHNPEFSEFDHQTMKLGIFSSTGKELFEQAENFVHSYRNKKFVGTLLGRGNPTRLRLAYEIDRYYPGNNFTVFQSTTEQVLRNYCQVSDLYATELTWLNSKRFDVDIKSRHTSGMIDWRDSNNSYLSICNEYQIEIICETDAFSNFWFTEKTARCLAIGKPFILIAGTHSLSKLKNMGFVTFESVIDESYDQELTPTKRITSALMSLNKLATSKDKLSLIDNLYKIANLNKRICKDFSI